MSIRVLAVAALAVLLSGPGRTAASDLPKFAALLPDATAAEAFADRYGQAIIDELVTVLMESADPACLRNKRLDRTRLAAKAEEILVRLGQRMLDRHKSFVDGAVADAHFEQAAGPGGLAELRALSADADASEVRRLAQMARREATVDSIIEAFDHYGDASEALERLITERGGPTLKRYVDLVLMARDRLAGSDGRGRRQRVRAIRKVRRPGCRASGAMHRRGFELTTPRHGG